MTKKKEELNEPNIQGLSPKERYLHKHFEDVKEQKRKTEKMLKQLNNSKLSRAVIKRRDGSYKIDKSLKIAIQTNRSLRNQPTAI